MKAKVPSRRLSPTKTDLCTVLLPDDALWRAVETRDAMFDGTFVYGVISTRIFCRPTCPSRKPKRANVRYFEDCKAAEAAGFRACHRCRPHSHSGVSARTATIISACRRIESADWEPRLEELAQAANLSPHHFQRVFKSIVRLSPKSYARALRQQRERATLSSSRTVMGAIYDSGYGSSARFYDGAAVRLGMQPRKYRSGGDCEHIRFAIGKCSLGAILVAATEHGICKVSLGDDPDALLRDLEVTFNKAELIGGDSSFEHLVALVIGLVEQPSTCNDLPLDIRGTAFQYLVWEALCRIPPGATATYAEVARLIDQPTAARAVAGACAANPVAVVIPCHRVVRTDGELSGYRWGIERKRDLLKRESGN